MPATYESIATTTLSSLQSSVTFSSISGSYTDLVLIANAAGDTTATNFSLRFNGDSATNYSYTRIYGDGTSIGSDNQTNYAQLAIGINGNSSTEFTTHISNIQNYSNTTTFKTSISRSGYTTSGYVAAYASLWRSTAAINQITIRLVSGSFRSGSTFTLYGIKAA